MNGLKTMVLMVTLTLMLVAIGGLLGGKSGMTFALIMAFGMNFITYLFSDKIVLKMYGAKPVTEAEAPELYGIVRRLAHRAELPMPKVYIMDEDQPNAFATGRNPNHGVVAVTTGIMRILSREELEGVIAHELAHIKHRDILVGTVAATIAGAISYLAQMAQWAMIFGGRHDDEEGGSNPIAAIVMMIVGPIAAHVKRPVHAGMDIEVGVAPRIQQIALDNALGVFRCRPGQPSQSFIVVRIPIELGEEEFQGVGDLRDLRPGRALLALDQVVTDRHSDDRGQHAKNDHDYH